MFSNSNSEASCTVCLNLCVWQCVSSDGVKIAAEAMWEERRVI